MVYQVPIRGFDKLDVGASRPLRVESEIPYTGIVQGQDASDLEENVAWAHEQLGIEYIFKYYVPFLGLDDRRKEIDIVGIKGFFYPIEVDGDIGHSTAAQKGADHARDMLLNPILRKNFFMPIIHLSEEKIGTREDALREVRNIYQ